jgi:hypothetical protein
MPQQPVGRTALHVLERATKPIVVVPQAPDAARRPVRQLRRLLVPLEGTDQSARPVAESLTALLHADVELLVLHVYTPATVPPMLDRPARDQSLWGEEFVARFLPAASSIGLRAGSVSDRVIEAVGETDADLVVLSWAQNMSPGHATVIRDVLTRVPVPVLLLPAAQSPTVSGGEGAAGRTNAN